MLSIVWLVLYILHDVACLHHGFLWFTVNFTLTLSFTDFYIIFRFLFFKSFKLQRFFVLKDSFPFEFCCSPANLTPTLMWPTFSSWIRSYLPWRICLPWQRRRCSDLWRKSTNDGQPCWRESPTERYVLTSRKLKTAVLVCRTFTTDIKCPFSNL